MDKKNLQEIVDSIWHAYISSSNSLGALEIIDSIKTEESNKLDKDGLFMKDCRERTTNFKKCEYCDLRFDCYTSPWKGA